MLFRSKNNGNGIRAIAAAGTGGINVNVRDSVIAGNLIAGFESGASGASGFSAAMITGTMISGNATGVRANSSGGGFAAVRVGGSTITANTTGIASVSAGQVLSHGDNKVIDNTGGETFAGTIALK